MLDFTTNLEQNSPSLKIPLIVNASSVFCEWRNIC